MSTQDATFQGELLEDQFDGAPCHPPALGKGTGGGQSCTGRQMAAGEQLLQEGIQQLMLAGRRFGGQLERQGKVKGKGLFASGHKWSTCRKA
ncbi:hypothetical protein DMX06_14510 [Pseudomonas mosselii]|nr:hypothetical protein DMX06_14510 [Pseudomonas mosselii]